jgi:predicted pyridoxine 5'-phosphate oxidase superfamily flavin-nucleotide-binding protein
MNALAATNAPAWPSWHEGEQALQARAGSAEQLAAYGPRIMRDRMPLQHREFFAQLPFLLVGAVGAGGQPWAGVLAAPPGFVQSPDDRHLRIEALPAASDPLAEALRAGAPIGLLGIEPPTRRRNRANGVLRERDAQGFVVEVQQSFGNCPKYIQARTPRFVAPAEPLPVARRSDRLDDSARRIITGTDTFFIASAHPRNGDGVPAHGVDVSHRGGRPGFVRVLEDGSLAVPDFIGNSFFNTLGNLALEPRAGLLFIDFERGDLLQLAVRAELMWARLDANAFEGIERWLRMEVEEVIHRPAALPLRWSAAELSPFLPAAND